MICPVCRFGNFPGDDVCSNCGADLWSADTPQPATTFHGRLLGMHLDELGAPAPASVEVGVPVDEAIARMQADGIDCLLVTDHGELVGIFTDRDAILKVAGRPSTSTTSPVRLKNSISRAIRRGGLFAPWTLRAACPSSDG